jgi:hypothetical protein
MPALLFLLLLAFLLGISIGWWLRRTRVDGRRGVPSSAASVSEPGAESLPMPAPGQFPRPFPGPIPVPIPVPIPEPIPEPIPRPFPFPSPIPNPIPIPIPIPTPTPLPIPIPIPIPDPNPHPRPIPDPGQICVLPAVPDQVVPAQLASALALHFSGSPADGSRALANSPSGPVVWVDRGDEVLVHLESTQVRIQDTSVLVSVDLETDQTGRQPLVVVFSLGNGGDAAGLVATTDELPRGNALLASRWGQQLQQAVWASFISMSQTHASERRLAPLGLVIKGNTLNFQAGAPLVAVAPTQVIG